MDDPTPVIAHSTISSNELKTTAVPLRHKRRDQLTGESRQHSGASFDSEHTEDSEADICSTRDETNSTTSSNQKSLSVDSYSPLEFVESLVVKPDMTFKILIVGNPYVGKSCFLMRLCTNTYTTRYASTIGVDFYSRLIRLKDEVISLQLWDTAGQERFQSVTRAYYRGAHGVILMYDISSEESFIAVKTWINSIENNMDEVPTSLLLVGNKTDLDDYSQREVLYETGENFAKVYNAEFIETSAKTGYNVGYACLKLINLLVASYRKVAWGSTMNKSHHQPMAKLRKKQCCQ